MVNKVTKAAVGAYLRGTRLALNETIDSVNGLLDLVDAQIIDGDSAIASQAVRALTLDGQVLMQRVEKTVDEENRPVWICLNYLFAPAASPIADIDYHAVDIFGDVAISSYSIDLQKVNLYLLESKSFYSGVETLKGNYAAFFEASNRSSGTVKSNVALRLWSRNNGTGHVDNLYGVRMTAPTNNGTIDNAFGIHIADVDVATNNYALYTGLGKVRIGDDLHVIGDSFSESSTSKEDITENRHVRVGDFGIGSGQKESGIDLNDIVVSRTFSGNNFINAPTSSYYYIRTTIHDDNWAEQWATGLTGSTKNKIHRRVKDNNIWMSWVELVTA